MKKIKFLLGALLIILVFGTWSCSFGGDDDDDPNYTKKTVHIPYGVNNVFMFVTNLGNSTLSADSYKYILASDPSRTITETNQLITENDNLSKEDYSEYTCGLGIEAIRKSYNPDLLQPRSSSSRAATGTATQYNKKKNQAKASDGSDGNTATKTDFWVMYTDPTKSGTAATSTKKISATCRYVDKDENGICQIFVQDGYYDDTTSTTKTYTADSSDSNTNFVSTKITKAGVEKIAEKFNSIYKPEQALLGEANLDNLEYYNVIETSERITILISYLGYSKVTVNGQQGFGANLGYFYGNDLLCNCNDEGQLVNEAGKVTYYNGQTLYTNQRMMFTLNTIGFYTDTSTTDKSRRQDLGGEDNMYSTLGHEFNHMLNTIHKSFALNAELDTWFTEMLSAMTEDFTPEYLEIDNTVQSIRIPSFLTGTTRGMINWDGNGDLYASYGFAYAFGAYLVRNYGGVNLIHEMATNSYTGRDAITNALKECGYNETFESVLAKFGVVLANPDGADKQNATLNKSVKGNLGSYTYNFSAINLLDNNYKNIACLYSYNIYPNQVYAGGFFVSSLGHPADWDYSLDLRIPNDSNIAVTIYAR